MSHLARLVRDQLLITCTAEIFRPSSSPSSSTSLWKADPLKLTSLEKRLGGGEEDDPDKTKWNSPWERKNTKFPGTQVGIHTNLHRSAERKREIVQKCSA